MRSADGRKIKSIALLPYLHKNTSRLIVIPFEKHGAQWREFLRLLAFLEANKKPDLQINFNE